MPSFTWRTFSFTSCSQATTVPLSMEDQKKDTPGVLVFPPLLFGGTLALGLLAQLLWPLHLTSWPGLRWIGITSAVASAVLAIWGSTTMRRAGTNVNPNAPTVRIVQN